MWNPVNAVATGRLLPEAEFVCFALKHDEKYGIDIVTPSHVLVSNWNVDELVKDFRTAFPELCERTRVEKIAELKEQNKNG